MANPYAVPRKERDGSFHTTRDLNDKEFRMRTIAGVGRQEQYEALGISELEARARMLAAYRRSHATAPSAEAGAPEDEIEVTPAMLKAGAETFENWRGLEYGDSETAAYAIFTAMVLASEDSDK